MSISNFYSSLMVVVSFNVVQVAIEFAATDNCSI